MARPKKQPQDRVRKEGFSAPQYVMAAARRAARLDEGNDFSRWIVLAIREKLRRDEPGLMERMRVEMGQESLPMAAEDKGPYSPQ